MNKRALIFTFLIAIVTIVGYIVTINLSTYLQNKRTLDFSGSPRQEFMHKEALYVAEKFCGGEHEWSQMGYDNDHEHVGIICYNGNKVEIKIKSDLPTKGDK